MATIDEFRSILAKWDKVVDACESACTLVFYSYTSMIEPYVQVYRVLVLAGFK